MCATGNVKTNRMKQCTHFGCTESGEPVNRISIKNAGMTACILTYGATVQDLRLEGIGHPLVLGSDTIEPYFDQMRYFGATVGRFANRIAEGRFQIGASSFSVPGNWKGSHALHGGAVGTAQKLWTIENILHDRTKLSLILRDGEMGFPGEMLVSVEFLVGNNQTLHMTIDAKSTKPTPCSFTHHGYFNLSGNADISDHELNIHASHYLPVDADLIPTGEIKSVDGTEFDFRKMRCLSEVSLDHNFCVSNVKRPLRRVASLRSRSNGLTMAVETTEPGLQVYCGGYIPESGLPGTGGRTYGPFAGLALEPQAWPDAPNNPEFPSAILHPDETYRHELAYCFDS